MAREPIELVGKSKRLKSLNEFSPPYWLGLFNPDRSSKGVNWIAVAVGFLLGISIGLMLIL